MIVLSSYKEIEIRKDCIICLKNIINYDTTKINDFGEDDFQTLGQLIYDNPKINNDCLELINQIVINANDEVVQKLVENYLLTSLVKVLETGSDKNRYKAAFILSNISATPSQLIQDLILEDKIYKPIMKSLFGDLQNIKKEIGMFLTNLIRSSAVETMTILIEKKKVLKFLSIIINEFIDEVQIVLASLKAYQILVQTISQQASPSESIQYFKQIDGIGLFKQIESLTYNQNDEINNLAQTIFKDLQDSHIINEIEIEINSQSP